MLKSIEISGFKSFADKTRMDFSEGISVLVGPNGSGKSNIVDAIKWVLGEQSVKKLRGNEMTDVIFNGSETRQPSNVAEVTLAFDNTSRFLSLDTPTVALTRRVYRSGESEYLINRQTARLKDIRELLSGTGLGLQAYSIIEQGRVELLLQSTSTQRRGVLEEAAGVARFNAKKQEVARRLERTEQNLLRLSDIVSEVESQLRSAKSQAGKAHLYRQYVSRIQELRTEVSLVDWREKKSRIDELETSVAELESTRGQWEKNVAAGEAGLLECNGQIDSVDSVLRGLDAEIASVREQIAGADSTAEMQLSQRDQLEKELFENGRQLLSLNMRRGDTEEMVRKTDDEIFEARKHLRQIAEEYESQRARLDETVRGSELLRERGESLQRTLQELTLEKSRSEGEKKGLAARRDAAFKTKVKREKKLESLRKQIDEIVAKNGLLQGDTEELSQGIFQHENKLAALNGERALLDESLASRRQELADQKQRLSGMTERISLLDDLLSKHEGVGCGVKEVLRRSAEPDGPFRPVYGLVADLIRVNVEAAPLIEMALGADAQHVVVSPDPEFFRFIEENEKSFAGQVSFIWPDPHPKDNSWQNAGSYEGRPGVLGRADRFVETEPQFEHLVWRLLGRTWIVENLACAKALYRESDGRTSFITLDGQALNANGTLVVGPRQPSGGLVTRRSELRTLVVHKSELELAAGENEAQVAVLEKKIAEAQKLAAAAQKEHQGLIAALDAVRIQQVSNRQQNERVGAEYEQLQFELSELTAELETLEQDLTSLQNKRTRLDEQSENVTKEASETEKQLAEVTASRREQENAATGLKIELAKSEERLDSLTARKNQFEENQRERQKLLEDHDRRSRSLQVRRTTAELTVLRAESLLAELYSRKETLMTRWNEVKNQRALLAAEKKKSEQELKKAEQELAKNREVVHSRRLEVERLAQESRLLSDRMREDYGIDLAVAAQKHSSRLAEEDSMPTSVGSPDDCRREIESVRSKMQKLGSVNLEAIETLESLESRHTALFNQYNDLQSARRSIQKITERINVDGQRLFEETFESVKIYFCDIFQKLFGGGHADIVFENPETPMESGIEIVARPPGKDLKNVMLLSGGEKTLTCVAFLLAVFRHHAGPVCILDEVDAALDEGNVGRFTSVIQEFKTDTQFFIITHSKKTMTAAKTLYGVTMQDSGVSKLIAVQFDEVGENGEIIERAPSGGSETTVSADGAESAA